MTDKCHILIIDDDPLTARLFGAKLAESGFEVLYAHEADAGREMARRFSPDLILLDIRMAPTDGYQVAARLKEEKKTAGIPIVFLTNEDLTPEAEKDIKELWAEDYIHKSVDLNEFVRRVRTVLERCASEK